MTAMTHNAKEVFNANMRYVMERDALTNKEIYQLFYISELSLRHSLFDGSYMPSFIEARDIACYLDCPVYDLFNVMFSETKTDDGQDFLPPGNNAKKTYKRNISFIIKQSGLRIIDLSQLFFLKTVEIAGNQYIETLTDGELPHIGTAHKIAQFADRSVFELFHSDISRLY